MTAAPAGGPAPPAAQLARLAELGLTLPHVATPAGSYLPTARVGDLVFTAGSCRSWMAGCRPPARSAPRCRPRTRRNTPGRRG